MAAPEPRAYSVMSDGSTECPPGLLLGNLHLREDGWRFYPTFKALPSNKGWPTPQAALNRRLKGYTLEGVQPAEDAWVICVAGYGAFLFKGTEQAAEEMRSHKASWEGGAGHKRRATVQEAAGEDVSMCLNHPLFVRKRLSRYVCECARCRKGDIANVYVDLDAVKAGGKKEQHHGGCVFVGCP